MPHPLLLLPPLCRYALLPYLYTQFLLANGSGAPIMRPLFYDFPAEADVFALQHTFMLGGLPAACCCRLLPFAFCRRYRGVSGVQLTWRVLNKAGAGRRQPVGA